MQRGCTFKCTLIKGAMLSLEYSVHYIFMLVIYFGYDYLVLMF
nr:MAG TPA: hypothetical protein [Bacteriophage sp.]